MKRFLVVLAAVAGVGSSTPAHALPTGCAVAIPGGPVSCVYIALPGTGVLTLTVNSGFAVANVACTVGGAVLAGTAPSFQAVAFTRAGLCILQITGNGSARATAN